MVKKLHPLNDRLFKTAYIEKGDIMTLKIETSKTSKNTWIYASTLLILLIAATFIFGLHVLWLTVVSFAVSLLFEYLFAKFRKKPLDAEWMITPLLLVLLLPPAIPLWTIGIAAFFALLFGKGIFGGSGKYIFTPALVGYVFVLISFPQHMALSYMDPITDIIGGVTPLNNLNGGVTPYPYTIQQLLLGNVPGSIGETFRLGIILLGVLLMGLKVIDFKVPLTYLATFFLLTAIFYFIFPDYVNGRGVSYGKDPLISLFVGSILFGAFFLSADTTISPASLKGKIIFGLGLGFLTFVIRNFATFQEGVTFSLLIMAAISPLIDLKFPNEAVIEEVKA